MKPPYDITKTILDLYGQITEALGICQSFMLVKPEARLRRQNRIKTIQSSLSIEGNTLNIENVTALLDNQRIIGPKKDIIEVQNAIKAYDQLNELRPFNKNDFLSAHGILMKDLVKAPGEYRKSQVGIMKGKEVTHIAPTSEMVPGLMNDLFKYLKEDTDLEIIKSCVFHYEMEFIHPFEDGNGRMGRYWQTRILMKVNPIFEFVPIEKLIKDHQKEYYQALSISDNTGKSTVFIEFMLNIINQALRDTINESKPASPDYQKRTEVALSQLDSWFDRKEYMKVCKGISSATASRDLKQLIEENRIESTGKGRMTKYRMEKSG
ncbi:Fic family protein [Oceanispirochaeta crateris]|uniref:Fic family protein n=1 Tax=Oceanispirochaeta crateris TaxID=2518645 RepID=A0A5C1QI86_9SPIO|nr:Fic family protein [Oceanispirochaeta crateris]QEN06829.1 Fic family protein [Oceanispirochaeta crateris]QEN06839.1 Fic family protein [Oceanispirochaeta crateris]